MWNFAKIRNKYTTTNIINYVEKKAAFILIIENGLVHLSNRDCIDREKTRAVIEKGEKMYGPDFMLLDKKEQKEIMLRFFGQLYEDKDVDDDVRDEILTLAMLFKEKLEDMGFRSSVIDST
ncbi:hypothetical protein RB195_026550 [Necator americanus]|uniref:Uncharacterized protein n=1 Tax=Necator americanus TaxID=51031 RepID=A0ABR1EXJ2_NECAM